MLNEQQIRGLFDKLNKEFFNNALPQPIRIEFHFVKKYLGQFHYDKSYAHNGTCVIRFSTAWEMTDFEVEKVLIHEMVHEWQWTVGHSDHHGAWFKHKANEINRLTNNKYKIARLTSLKNNTCLKDTHQKFEGGLIFYTTKSRPNTTFAAICPFTSINTIKNWLPKHENITSTEFYLYKGEGFKSWKRSVKKVWGYPIEKEEFKSKYAKSLRKY